MDALSVLGVVSQGLRLVKEIIPANSRGTAKPLDVSGQHTFGQVFLDRLDEDGDGALTLNEVKISDRLFNRLDSNGDGVLSLQELNDGASLIQRERGIGHQVNEYISTHDADHDSRLSKMESGLDDSIFGRIDTNHDKSINRGEITSAYTNHTLDLTS